MSNEPTVERPPIEGMLGCEWGNIFNVPRLCRYALDLERQLRESEAVIAQLKLDNKVLVHSVDLLCPAFIDSYRYRDPTLASGPLSVICLERHNYKEASERLRQELAEAKATIILCQRDSKAWRFRMGDWERERLELKAREDAAFNEGVEVSAKMLQEQSPPGVVPIYIAASAIRTLKRKEPK